MDSEHTHTHTHTHTHSHVGVKQRLALYKMDTANRVQILDEAVCVSHRTNILEKFLNPPLPPPLLSYE